MNSAQSKKRVLFVCSHNRVRSLTAEAVYRGRPDLEVRSAGIADDAPVPVPRELLDWADQVFVFSNRQRKFIEGHFGSSAPGRIVVNVRLPDRFMYKSPELIMELTRRIFPYLGRPANGEPARTPESAAPALAPRAAETSPLRRSQSLLRRVAAWSVVCALWSWFCNSQVGPSQLR